MSIFFKLAILLFVATIVYVLLRQWVDKNVKTWSDGRSIVTTLILITWAIGIGGAYYIYDFNELTHAIAVLFVVIPPAMLIYANYDFTQMEAKAKREEEESKPEPEPEPVPEPPPDNSFKKFLHTNTRFEHTHVLGAPGAGKTELLKYLISEDIETNASVIVIAPKGNLIRSLARLTAIDSDRLILVGPDDKYPPALNVFDLHGDVNQSVSLLNYVFSSILEAETTSKQTALLNYCIRLLLNVPNATLLTLRDLLGQDTLPQKYIPYVEKLSESGRHFFTQQFGSQGKDGYKETKGQMRWRLDLLLENPIIEKIFCQTETLISMKDVMAGGKVLLIDTSIKKLGDFGSSFFGRYFIALIALAAEQRDTTRSLRPVYVYIDEASSYLTDYLETLLDRARESRVGLTIAHQHLKQLSDISTKLEASVHNTAIKIVGRCNDHDARKMGAEMGLEFELLQRQAPLHFYVSARNSVFGWTVQPGYLEGLPQRTDREMNQFIARNRERVSSLHLVSEMKSAPGVDKYDEDAW